jgi:hypothetical protein
VAFEVAVENLADVRVAVHLADRIPVSRHKNIEVDKVRITPPVPPDSKGLLKWVVALKPKEKKILRIEYRLEYPPAAVQEMLKMKRSSGMPSDAMDLSSEIMSLEKSF